MSSEPAIRVANLGKRFELYDRPRDRLWQMLAGERRRFFREFWALRDVSFDIHRGECVGIVGRNGAGKSTLLQLVCGILTPSEGTLQASGRVAALLELGAGFNPEFTGRENVYLHGAILGLDEREIDDRFDDIAAFADIGDFLDAPVKVYSSGMVVRLAFAVQAQTDPEILIVDEALAVGDARFQVKCFERLRRLRQSGTTILFVSHATEQVVTHCDRAILLDGGRMVEQGAPRRIVNVYLDLLFGTGRASSDASPAQTAPQPPGGAAAPRLEVSLDGDEYAIRPGYNPAEYRWGDGAAALTDFRLAVGAERDVVTIDQGASVSIVVGFRFLRQVERPILGFAVKTREGVTIYNSNTEFQPVQGFGEAGAAGSAGALRIRFPCRLAPGDYFVSLGLASRAVDGSVIAHDRRYDSIHLQVVPSGERGFIGMVDLEAEFSPVHLEAGATVAGVD
jgi:lipopolysaccharide transport system ATP-binding protein